MLVVPLAVKRGQCYFPNSICEVISVLFKTIFQRWKCFMSSVATDGKDGQESKLKTIGPTFLHF